MTSFSDDFNRADNTDLGANWVEVSGDWSIISQQLSPGTTGTTVVLRAATAMAGNDNYAQIAIPTTSPVSQGVWCRGNLDLTSGYLWRNNGTSWDLFSVVGTTFTNIGTYSAAAAAGDVAKVQAVGSTITGWVNGVVRVTVTNTTVTTGTSVGLRSQATSALRYDNFAAGDVVTGVTLGIASGIETAQPLAGLMTAALGTASEVDTAQPLSGAKTFALAVAASVQAGQSVSGAKTASLGTASATESAQPLVGSKTIALGFAGEVVAAQSLVGAKAAALPLAGAIETAQPLATAKGATLVVASVVEATQQLTGAKSSVLGAAVETSTARPLATTGPNVDITVTVGAPYGSPYSVSAPQPGGWEVGAPC